MKIFLGIFLSVVLSTSFACRIIIKQKYNVIFIVIFSLLLFTPCLTSELRSDNRKTDPNLSSINHVSVASTVAPIHKSTALSSFILMLSERYPRTTWYGERKVPTTTTTTTITTTIPSTKAHFDTSDIDVTSTTTFAPFPIRAQKATARRKNASINNNTILILIQTMKNIPVNRIREQFREFANAFGVQLHNITVDFDVIDGLSTLVKRLDMLNYSTVYFMFDGNNIRDAGSICNMAHQLSTAYRKQIIVWPCPQMKVSERHLPSFQTVSYAIKSISQKFNWTEAVIFAGHEWGLPLAIAANLHLPYRIKIGLEDFNEFPSNDIFDRLFIITSPLNSPETLSLLNRLNVFNRSKILVIDIIGTIFNKQNEFYNAINRNKDKWLASNLLVLTTLTTKLKRYLNATLTNEYNSIYGRMNNNEPFMETKSMAIDENAVIAMLMQRMQSERIEENIVDERNIFDFFNGTQLKLVDSLYEKILNDSRDCKLRVENVSKSHALHTNVNKSVDNDNVTIDFQQNLNNSHHENATSCASHMEQITKCIVYLGERTKDMPTTNETRTLDNYFLKVLCEQLYQRQQHMNHILKNVSPSPANDNKQRNDTASVVNSDNNENVKRTNEFINLISTQMDSGQLNEYFPFFDFVLSKLVQTFNFTVNYTTVNSDHVNNTSNITNSSMDNDTGTTSVTDGSESDTFDFCVLDFRLNQVAINDINETNETSMQITFPWRPVLILRQNELHQNIFITHPLQSVGYRWFFDNTQKFWTCGLLCWILAGIVILLLVCIFVGSITFGLAIRNYLLKKRLSKGPNKIVLSAADFVFPVDARRVDEGIEAMLCCWLQQLQEFGGPEVEKPDLLKGSIGSLKNIGLGNTTTTTTTTTNTVPGLPLSATTIPTTANTSTITTSTTSQAKIANASTTGSIIKHNPCWDKRARYNGDLVQLKEMPSGASNELKSKAMDFLVMAHGLRHENINPLIGWLADPTRAAMVFEYCSRGSLQDVLIMDEIKLDWSFRLSLLTDLVRGMRYLHSSPMRVHGALTSRNCIVDARWVLKVTDYGLNQFYEAQAVQMPPLTAKEMLWTSPELLRNSKGNNKCGTQSGDVYSFGIIMQEVVVRGEPYCMLSLSAEEIVSKLKKPPPLIRPSVSKGAAPPEAINIMRQCWAETPDMRPDFNSVYERFKVLNHGRKVNFVDTMFQLLEKYSNNLEELIRERTDQLDIERKKTEQLLNRMLPSSVAEKLKLGLNVEPEEYSDVTIYFSDIVGFTTIAAYCSPVQVVDLLNDLYTCFDATINAYSVYKVETIGDAYMVVSGLPVRIPDHAGQIATMALDLLHQSGRFKIKHLPEVPLQLRIGLHTGPCCAGVVGLTMPRYCLFGDTVNTASRMESTGTSWRIHLSEATRDRLEKAGGYHLEPRGGIEIKGKGLMNTYWLLGKKGFDKPLPQPPTVGESHGLDETLIQHCIRSKQRTKTPCISTTHSSSQSSSLAGEPIDVKVEITPPRDIDSVQMPNSFSIESNPTVNLGLSMNEFKVPSPLQRKMSELPSDSLLNAANYGRLTPSPSSTSSCKIYKKFEEFLDLSMPYNHYRCLSPSESNLTQCHDGKYIYGVSKLDNKPGSSRLLRRQFSLDKDDCNNASRTSTIAQLKSSLDVPYVQDIPLRSSSSPTNIKPARLHKQNSASVALDLEKIEEIPISPKSCGFNHRGSYLSRIPGSAAGSPASKKPIDSMEIITTIATLEVPDDFSPRAISPISATTICSNSTNGGDSDGANGNICYHI